MVGNKNLGTIFILPLATLTPPSITRIWPGFRLPTTMANTEDNKGVPGDLAWSSSIGWADNIPSVPGC
jgi:hypothetical protein